MPLRSAAILATFAACTLLGGCARGPAVPKDAKLIWFGSPSFQLPTDDLPSGTFYLVEEGLVRKTVSAAYRTRGTPLHFNGLKDKRRYRMYFAEGGMPSATTRPAAGGGA